MTSSKIQQIIIGLALLSGFCVALEMGRIYFTFDTLYVFMPWNLLLAWVPLLLAVQIQKLNSKKKLIAIIILWLIFFPNAPYIITDLLHLRPRLDSPYWYDVMLLFSFAFAGLLTGILSALMVLQKLQTIISPLKAKACMLCAMLLSGYGIYIGRFLRFNSWDVLVMPQRIFYETGLRLIHPMAYPRAYGVTLLSAALLTLMLFIFESLLIAE